VRAGRELFIEAGCDACHGTTLFSNSIKDYTSPPAPDQIANERMPLAPGTNPVGAPYVHKFITNIGSFNTFKFSPIMPENKLFSGEHPIKVWITDDKNKIPVKIKANLVVGALDMEITEARGLRNN
jgi:hypothetical protein